MGDPTKGALRSRENEQGLWEAGFVVEEGGLEDAISLFEYYLSW